MRIAIFQSRPSNKGYGYQPFQQDLAEGSSTCPIDPNRKMIVLHFLTISLSLASQYISKLWHFHKEKCKALRKLPARFHHPIRGNPKIQRCSIKNMDWGLPWKSYKHGLMVGQGFHSTHTSFQTHPFYSSRLDLHSGLVSDGIKLLSNQNGDLQTGTVENIWISWPNCKVQSEK